MKGWLQLGSREVGGENGRLSAGSCFRWFRGRVGRIKRKVVELGGGRGGQDKLHFFLVWKD